MRWTILLLAVFCTLGAVDMEALKRYKAEHKNTPSAAQRSVDVNVSRVIILFRSGAAADTDGFVARYGLEPVRKMGERMYLFEVKNGTATEAFLGRLKEENPAIERIELYRRNRFERY